MAYLETEAGVKLYYEEHGKGRPIIFIHGVMMSGRFFAKQIPYFSRAYQMITLDLRGHGKSSKVPYGHTIAQYAKDLKRFIKIKKLQDVILVGWSMGAFVLWDYIDQFGTENVKALVLVDQSPSDYRWPDWEYGAFDFAAITSVMQAIQEDQCSFNRDFIYRMFKKKPNSEDHQWMLEEMNKLPAAIASTIIFNQTAVDYREKLSNVDIATLLCFGTVGFFPVEAGKYMQRKIPNSKLIAFKNSSHLPFLEETERFNRELDVFLQRI